MSLPRITDSFVCVDDCPVCAGSGAVCEEHPSRPWDDGDACCGAAGAPCPHAGCKFADAVKIVPPSVFDLVGGDVLTWPCGIVLEVGRGNLEQARPVRPVRYFLPQLRALHRSQLVAMLADEQTS
jgi:hypothetical protein